jgi:hypothetical protein
MIEPPTALRPVSLPSRPWVDRVFPPAALAALAFLAYFRQWSRFGLYGDDFAFFGQVINRDWAAEIEYLRFCLTRWPQGRPLGMGVNLGLVPHFVFTMGGLGALHLFAFAVFATNSAVLYRLLARASPPAVAFAGAAFYAVSPADTVKCSLIFAYNFQLTILLGLLTAHAALSRRHLLVAFSVAAIMLMAEPVAMFVLVAPPLLAPDRRSWWGRPLLRHLAGWLAAVSAVLFVRRAVGDPWGAERVSEIASAPGATVRRALESAVTGVATHARLVAERMALPVRELDAVTAAVVGSCVLLVGAVLAWAATRGGRESRDDSRAARDGLVASAVLLATGLATMLAVYASYFRAPWYPASWRTGFMSGVHVFAAIGSAVAFAGIVQALAAAVPRRLAWVAIVAPALATGLLAGFGEVVQRDYVAVWSFQRGFWRAFRELCRDAGSGTYVLILDRHLPHPRFIELFSWGTEVLPGELFVYPEVPAAVDPAAGWRPKTDRERASVARGAHPPVVMLAEADPAQRIRFDATGYHWKTTWYFMLPKGPEERPRSGNVILLELRDGEWARLGGEVPVEGGTLRLRPPEGDRLERLPLTPLARVFGLG